MGGLGVNMAELIYNRIAIHVGSERLTARPIDFDLDERGNAISVKKYETTCPDCGGSIQFEVGEIQTRDDEYSIKCPSCNLEPFTKTSKRITIKPTGQIPRKLTILTKEELAPWTDPILAGIFDKNEVDKVQ